MYWSPGLNSSNGNTSLVTIRGTIGVLVLVFALLVCSGCVQPDKTMVQIPVNTSMNSTGTLVPVVIPSPALAMRTRMIPVPVTHLVTNGPALRVTIPPYFRQMTGSPVVMCGIPAGIILSFTRLRGVPIMPSFPPGGTAIRSTTARSHSPIT